MLSAYLFCEAISGSIQKYAISFGTDKDPVKHFIYLGRNGIELTNVENAGRDHAAILCLLAHQPRRILTDRF